ncbi:dTDP-4-dehydrorhamnose reductase [Aromatoleum petrolei]|uniref:dTDP-4-dehydrorhamnose reductase n=1 Tax=Aromatoleum petrolei TaxID=76116 RepID=A0ABX1MTK9_9RHOO|nr:dTDP-4-dehydrorhamnose reductase [Aromatoleum petrolei]NMF90016.1 dTDP-4-dehydrorhamnose reductase [Aromatoleum petrolei]QTQ36292.1 dTDP-4-dehydrorhamnose reductase [Aromatoleum petrolei]
MKLLVTGANGQVGWELARSLMPLGEVIALHRSRCDLSRPETLAPLVAELAPDVIVNAAAYTAVDKAESEEALATTINGTAPGELARAAKAAGALLIHYSTDYVFDGTKSGPYTEDDPVAPVNAYGRSKLAGEMAIREAGCDHLILRTTWVFAARGGNFVRTMLRLGAEREQLRVVADQHGAPTWARNIADATALILAQAQHERRGGAFASGIFNLAAAGETSWHGFAEAIFAEARSALPDTALKVASVEPIPASAYPTPAARPANSRLSGGRLATRFGIGMPHWRDALRRCLEDIAR